MADSTNDMLISKKRKIIHRQFYRFLLRQLTDPHVAAIERRIKTQQAAQGPF